MGKNPLYKSNLPDVDEAINKEQCCIISDHLIEEILYYLSNKHLELNGKYMYQEEKERWSEIVGNLDDLRSCYRYISKNIKYVRQCNTKSFINLNENVELHQYTTKYNNGDTPLNFEDENYCILNKIKTD